MNKGHDNSTDKTSRCWIKR